MDLTDYIVSVPDFPIPGIDFKDITPLLSDPAAFHASVDQLLAACADVTVDKIGAFDARGFLWAAPMAYALNVPLVPIRKPGKLPRPATSVTYRGEYTEESVEVHSDAISPGDRVLLVDDVIALGGVMRAGCELVELLGGSVARCAAVIQFLGMGSPDRLRDYDVVSLVQY
jgi:adenine phosphoribosyltransferase